MKIIFMESTKINSQRVLKFFQDNLSIIVIVPAFIGGLWQAIELVNISLPYLRFFSISQIIPDGLLILMFMIVSAIPMFLTFVQDYWEEGNKIKDDEIVLPDDENLLKRFIKRNIRILLIIVFISYTIIFSLRYYNKEDASVLKIYFLITICIIIYISATIGNIHKANKLQPIKYIRLFRLFYLLTCMSLIITLCREIHRNFLLTDSFVNIEKANTILKEKFPNGKSELLYFNDKYLFYKIELEKLKDKKNNKDIEKIYVLELNEIFKE